MTILKAENISKQYRLGLVGTGTLSHDLNRWWAGIRGKEDPYLKVGSVNDRSTKADSEYVWALKDINFEVQQGEVLGIIGKNGAGKSTLLKILSRVTIPTTGEIKTKGRIASLLEVGTGFHPELTGRENIYLNGAILGMSKAEIKSKEAEIIDFSGCERYVDTPVKRYSSGMRVRLAFAVAAFLEPDILVIDEVLAVGDAEFQKKAIGKMQDISKGDGRTVIFVSHDMNAVSVLTSRVIVLKNGIVDFDGDTDEGIKEYLKGENNQIKYKYEGEFYKPKIVEVEVETSLPNNIHEFGKEIKFIFEIDLPYETDNLALSFQIVDEFSVPITHSWIFDADNVIKRDKGRYRFEGCFPHPKLYMGNYSLLVHLSNSKTKEKFDFLDSICHFKVQMMKTVRSEYHWQKNTCKYLEDINWQTFKK
ncbi:Polysaccharide ABC transporter, ATP-binding protein [Xanthomarina gelatinilytica]|uniref:Polysaccharide ABC transporter, ATP-binding protein n=1 Tax=Xanthomarina gelatinilytica TaxID=1137281 RepID=M7MK85_9FLAO|nr:ABC transporter ATP-binding protein [Xanthomarina gelatinilytica]EMQ95501.1 Polysaccharide ABC transporter, ATP-binding protein [Xanthomarina gelatinilytica]